MIKLARIFLSFHPINYLRRKSKRWNPPGFQGLSLYVVLKNFAKDFSVPYLTERAAAISYNFIMSVPPTCLFLFTLIPNLPFISKRTLKVQLHGLITDIIPAHTYNKSVIQFVDEIINGSKIGLISFTFLLSLFFASNAVMGLMRSFNKDYIGFKKIKGLKKRWLAIKLTVLLFGLLLICLILLFIQSNILNMIGIKSQTTKEMILYGKWLFIIGLIFYTYAFIYKYAPSTTKRWKLVSPGAIIATCLSIVATIGFSSFVNNFGRYNLLYGSIGTVMVLMIMIFLNSLVVLIGFEFNLSINTLKTIEENKKERKGLEI
ncbi:MAG: YihY/virulence factor BrkB family protein [Bacteroidota bacterium]|nr:YihY/virulence factor BrkB family protein [Bacteroidota bacterium]MDQ6889622.1 YihY/virulence factor BrkB family protein [Bacteroidota bacterium]